MPSQTFFCPSCKRQLTKSDQAYVLGETMANPNASFIALGSMPKSITCPGCGASIDAEKMIRGEYDGASATPGDGSGVVGFLVFVGLFALIVMGLDQPWWAGAGAGLVGAVVASNLWTKTRAK